MDTSTIYSPCLTVPNSKYKITLHEACCFTVQYTIYNPPAPLSTHTHTQSITVPLQGFLNAIVYGWTREDFLYIMASTKRHTPLNEPQINDIDVPALGEHDGLLSDLETSSNYESDSEPMYHNRYRRQQTPETNLSGNW